MFALRATMNQFGHLMEYHTQSTEKPKWTSFMFGSLAGIVPQIVIVMKFLSAIASADADPPGVVYAIIPTIFGFFNIFVVSVVLQYKKVGPWKDELFYFVCIAESEKGV